MTRFGLAAALVSAALLPGCGSIPPAAVGAVAGTVTAALRLDDDILRIVTGRSAPQPQKDHQMPITLPIDEIATIPVVIDDQAGRPVAIPAGGSASIDNTAVATVALSADGSTITVTPVGTGSCNLTYSNGSLTASAAVSVVLPAPSAASFGTPTLAPAPAPSASPSDAQPAAAAS
jgi:hypothetical protein